MEQNVQLGICIKQSAGTHSLLQG